MKESSSKRTRNIALFAVLVILWTFIDQMLKARIDAYPQGADIAGPFLGVFDVTCVHNTGGAWGIFGGNPIALGVFSILVCILATLYLIFAKPPVSLCGTIGISLIVAGGIGNAIDRFVHQYVIDFIRPIFIDFPVFNIADIGVTVGVFLFIASLIVDTRRRSIEDIHG